MDSSVKRRFHPLVLLVAISLMLACVVPDISPAEIPTTAPGAIDTAVVQTAAAASILTAAASSTQTAAASSQTPAAAVSDIVPTMTPSPTYIPAVTSSATPAISPTFIFILATFTHTPIPSDSYACKVTGQTPDNGTAIVAGQQFQVSWTVTNTGYAGWDPNSIDFIYAGGEKLSKSKALDFPTSVGAGGSTTLSLIMTAPSSPGTHKTIWALRVGKNEFCELPLNIEVK